MRPTGLVVSAPALARHGATLNRHDAEGQQRLRSCVEERAINGDAAPQPVLPDFRAFAQEVLDWRFSPKSLRRHPRNAAAAGVGSASARHRRDAGPQFAVRKAATGQPANQQAPSATEAPANNGNGESPLQLLVSTTARTETFDTVVRTKGGSDASAHGRMERLLRAAPAAPARDGRTPPPRGQPATRAGLQLG